MNLFQRITAATLTAAVTFGSIVPALARPTKGEQQPFNKEATIGLLRLVEQSGYQVSVDAPYCDEHADKGLLGVASRKRGVLICAANHQGNLPELADTVRHEVVHLAQFCKGRRSLNVIEVLFPQHQRDMLRFAIEELDMPLDAYHKTVWMLEGEARALAWFYDEDQIAHLFLTTCAEESLS